MRKLLVLLVAAAFVVSFSMPAMAETSFYGNVRMKTYMASQDEDAGDDSDLNWILDNGVSRFGAKFKADDVSANVEIRPNDGGYYRQWVGKWNFGGGTLVVGQTWTPTFQAIDESVIGGGVGSAGGSLRQPQLGLEMGSLTVALRQPSTASVLTEYKAATTVWITPADVAKADAKLEAGETTDYPAGYLIHDNADAAAPDLYYVPASGFKDPEFDTTLPAIEVSYDLKAGPAGITLFLGYNTYDEVDTVADKAYSVASYQVGGNVALSFGAVGVKVSIWQASNGGNGGFDGTAADFAGGEIKDATTLGYELLVAYKISDTMGLNVGYGSKTGDRDDAADTDTETATYVNLPIALAKNVQLVPEFLMLDHGVSLTGAEEGTETRIGARWKIEF